MSEAIARNACSFSEAVTEAVSLGLMESDPTKDLNNEYVSRVLMVLSIELGMGDLFEASEIQKSSDKLLESILKGQVDYNNFSGIDVQVKARVDAAKDRGCVLRHISCVNAKDKSVTVRLAEVPFNHIFAVTPPSCECVRFFTHSHSRVPIIVYGPSAGVESTSSALLAELLHLMRGKTTPHTLTLSRSGSGVVLDS